VSNDFEIAVIGVGCRFPDAWSPQQYWSNIDRGLVAMRELSEEQLRSSGVPDRELRSPEYVRVGTTLPGVADYAAEFFGHTPREARGMDPQQRIFLEASWEALESAGHPPGAEGGPLIGVFAGSAAGSYSAAMMALTIRRVGFAAAIDDIDRTAGGEPDFLTSRTAYKLGLRGPAVSVQAACASSLYAVHYAALSLLSGECDIALAGGATVLEPVRGYRYVPGSGQSEDGQCRSFDAGSSGTSYSSGIGVVVLRRLADALADGDHIYAVLRGSAVGNDGAQKAGFAAPSPVGVANVVGAALRVAGVPADLLRYVEAHGTATPLGDEIELAALSTALRTTTDRTGFCGLGSVKANIGHTGPASSIAGFIKAVHIARTGSLPPHPRFDRPRHPEMLAESPLHISTSAQMCTDADRHVLVNSIGFGGANAAAVLAAPPARVRPAATGRVRLLLSARNRVELDEMSRNLADALDRGDVPAADASHTLRVGRQALEDRRVVSEAPGRLSAALRLPRPPAARTVRSSPRRAAVVLTGDVTPPEGLVERLRSALPDRTEVVGPSVRDASDRFRIVIGLPGAAPNGIGGSGTASNGSRSDRHLLSPTGNPAEDADQIDAALAAAWLNGVTVDWEGTAEGRGRRVPLPTYPFTRKRYWALDGVSLADLSTYPGAAAAVGAQDAASGDGDGDGIERRILSVWRDLLDDDGIGLDHELAALGGTSLSSVQLIIELQQVFGIVVNVHRAGGGKATVRRMAELVRSLLADPDPDVPPIDRMDGDDDVLVDADLNLPLGPLAPIEAPGRDVLVTGATGFLGAFLLHELQQATTGRIYCLARAADETEGMVRLQATADRFLLPRPDPDRVHVVPGDLRDIARLAATYRDGELGRRVGRVVHSAARVVFTEPYRTLREHNVLPMGELLTWMRGCGIRDVSFVSTAAATAPPPGAKRRALETRDQGLDPRLGGYGVSKWVGERLLDRADEDGMRVRVFRPGLIMADSATGAVNDKDLVYFTLASGLAVGAHPIDERSHDMAPVDVVAKAIVSLALSPSSVGRAYHLVAQEPLTLGRMFAMLAEAGLPTRAVPLDEWRNLVRDRALATGNPVLSATALLEIEGDDEGAGELQATGWQPWLRRNGMDPGVTADMLRRGMTFLARGNPMIGALLPELAVAEPVAEGDAR
jgi:phthiocerol/phenolphthiocerol synthesis type-I polyketide synthase E